MARNFEDVMEEYGEAITNFVEARVEEDYGLNGRDLFMSEGLDDAIIEDYVEEYFNQ